MPPGGALGGVRTEFRCAPSSFSRGRCPSSSRSASWWPPSRRRWLVRTARRRQVRRAPRRPAARPESAPPARPESAPPPRAASACSTASAVVAGIAPGRFASQTRTPCSEARASARSSLYPGLAAGRSLATVTANRCLFVHGASARLPRAPADAPRPCSADRARRCAPRGSASTSAVAVMAPRPRARRHGSSSLERCALCVWASQRVGDVLS